MRRLPSGLLLIAILAAGNAYAGDVYFERDVRPILKAHCFHCHGEAGEKEGNLDVRLVRFMKAGGRGNADRAPRRRFGRAEGYGIGAWSLAEWRLAWRTE